MKKNHNKNTALRRAVLIGLALSAAMWTTGMAETIEINKDYGNEYNKPGETITISGGADTAIQQTENQKGSLAITSQGNTISSDDKVAIQVNGTPADGKDYTLKIDAGIGKNTITSGANDGISSNNGNTILNLTGAENEINAAKDGIAVSGNGTGSNITLVANGEKGNTITAGTGGLIVSGGNAVSLKAANGTNTIMTTAEDSNGISVVGTGSVSLEAQENMIIARENGTNVSGGGKVTVTANGENGNHITGGSIGAQVKADSTLEIKANGDNTITGTSTTGVTNDAGLMTIQSINGCNIITGGVTSVHVTNDGYTKIIAYKDNELIGNGEGVGNAINSVAGTTEIIAKTGNNTIRGGMSGIAINPNASVTVSAWQGTNTITGSFTGGNGIYGMTNSSVYLNAQKNVIRARNGLFADGSSILSLNADNTNNEVTANKYGIVAQNNANVEVKANDDNIFSVSDETGYGIYAQSASQVTFMANGNNSIVASGNGGYGIRSTGENTTVSITSIGGSNTVASQDSIKGYGIYSVNGGNVSLTAANNNTVSGATDGLIVNSASADLLAENGNTVSSANGNAVYGYTNADISLTATNGDNVTSAGTLDEQGLFGSGLAVKAKSGAQLTFTANNGWNIHHGAIDTREDGTDVTMTGKYNAVYSAAKIDGAGDLNKDDSGKFDENTEVISALYAADSATITSNGELNIFKTYAEDPTAPDTLERTIWAYTGADINITGGTVISTDRYEETYAAQPGNSADIAIAAGTAVGLDSGTVTSPVDDRAVVTVRYDDYTWDGQTYQSSITGDILAAYAGQVDIAAKDGSDAGITVQGNILAGNNGILNLDLGKGGVLTGRADDYGDAGVIETSGHGTEFFDPAFSSTIFKGGEVHLTMGAGSQWYVTGQSWVTSINVDEGANAYIDLVNANTDRNQFAHALTVYNMNGDATFNMSLDADRSISDMLYMKKANGEYVINVVDAVSTEDMYANGFDGLRFATVGAGSDATFKAVTIGQGVNNIVYEIGSDAYVNNEENSAYNSSKGQGEGDEHKPGDDLVNGFFESTETPGVSDETAMQNAALYAAADEEGGEEGLPSAGGEVSETTNYKLIGRTDETSDGGKTVIAMSKVNYSNAVYMDRLNKRMGEARYIEGDDGLWVRMRHDRIGKEDAFRSMNTMFEIGYDWKDSAQKDGTHYRGLAFDYMRGTADYHNVAGEGDVRRGGLWYHDTWLGDKGHYTDYVVKYGRLSNDFDIYSELGEKISGDYDNDVWSVSAEYGRKKDLGNDWYFEPQAQLQYAYVTDASYTTSQGTKVDLDAIDSLIGRAGFRIGRDTDEANTVYFKADILHEFLGDQDIRAWDSTGTLSETYENEGTWYDVGFGFSHRMSEDKYMFLDVEHSFGNDNEDTYQVNIGLNMAF